MPRLPQYVPNGPPLIAMESHLTRLCLLAAADGLNMPLVVGKLRDTV
jgi:hypothetical protein